MILYFVVLNRNQSPGSLQIIILRMSTQIQKPYDYMVYPTEVRDLLRKKTPINGTISPFQQYMKKIDYNAMHLHQKFPEKDLQKIRCLLEQLDNDIEIAINILHEQAIKDSQNNTNGSSMVDFKIKTREQIRYQSLARENLLLKKAFMKLYNKSIAKKHEKTEIEKSIESLTAENRSLKIENSAMLAREFACKTTFDNFDIY